MSKQVAPSNSLDLWLEKALFRADQAVGRARNPFAFQRVEEIPRELVAELLDSSFVATLSPRDVLQPRHSAIFSLPGGGRTTLRWMTANELGEPPDSAYRDFAAFRGQMESLAAGPYRLQHPARPDETYVFVDPDPLPDKTQLSESLQELAKAHSEAQGIFVKFFLPFSLLPVFEQSDVADCLEIRWSVEQLRELIRNRMQWATVDPHLRHSLSQISDQTLTVERDPDLALAMCAVTPRRLLTLAERLLARHAAHESQRDLLGIEDWDSFWDFQPPKQQPTKPQSTWRDETMRLRVTSRTETLARIENMTRPEVYGDVDVHYRASDIALLHKALYVPERQHYTNAEWRQALDLFAFSDTGTNRVPSLAKQKVGNRLWNMLNPWELSNALRDFVSSEEPTGDRRQRAVHLFIPEDCFLSAYPWELLHDGQDFLLRNNVQIIRHVAFNAPAKDVGGELLPARILYIAPRPNLTGLAPDLTPRADWQALIQALPQHAILQDADNEVCTLAQLESQLAEKRDLITIVHFDGHGKFGRRCPNPYCHHVTSPFVGATARCESCGVDLTGDAQGYLYFERSDGTPDPVLAKDLNKILKNTRVRLVFLHSCWSAAAAGATAFSAVAAGLLQAEIPAVIGMLYNPQEHLPTAHKAIEKFYGSLAVGRSVVHALADCRALLYDTDFWDALSLYLRLGDDLEGQLFSLLAT